MMAYKQGQDMQHFLKHNTENTTYIFKYAILSQELGVGTECLCSSKQCDSIYLYSYTLKVSKVGPGTGREGAEGE